MFCNQTPCQSTSVWTLVDLLAPGNYFLHIEPLYFLTLARPKNELRNIRTMPFILINGLNVNVTRALCCRCCGFISSFVRQLACHSSRPFFRERTIASAKHVLVHRNCYSDEATDFSSRSSEKSPHSSTF